MTHEEIVEALHRAHLEHQGEDPDIVEDCAPCSMYAEWAAPLIRAGLAVGWDTGLAAAGESLLGIYNGGGSWTKPKNPYREREVKRS